MRIAIAAVALVMLLWAAKVAVPDPDFGLLMGWFGAVLAGPAMLLWAGSWSELCIDPVQRTVRSRVGFLRWGGGPAYGFADFDRVVIVPTIEQGNESVNVVGGGFNTKTSRNTFATRHELRLRGALFDVGVPLPPALPPADLESTARRIAAVGGWQALRLERVRDAGSGKLEAVELPLNAPR